MVSQASAERHLFRSNKLRQMDSMASVRKCLHFADSEVSLRLTSKGARFASLKLGMPVLGMSLLAKASLYRQQGMLYTDLLLLISLEASAELSNRLLVHLSPRKRLSHSVPDGLSSNIMAYPLSA